jgi:hypothetical protein
MLLAQLTHALLKSFESGLFHSWQFEDLGLTKTLSKGSPSRHGTSPVFGKTAVRKVKAWHEQA